MPRADEKARDKTIGMSDIYWRARKEGALESDNLDKIDITSIACQARDTT
jgi:hypothetical protein